MKSDMACQKKTPCLQVKGWKKRKTWVHLCSILYCTFGSGAFLNRISRLSHFTVLQCTILNVQNSLGGRRSNPKVYPGNAPSMFNNSRVFQSARPEPKQEPCKKYVATAAASLLYRPILNAPSHLQMLTEPLLSLTELKLFCYCFLFCHNTHIQQPIHDNIFRFNLSLEFAFPIAVMLEHLSVVSDNCILLWCSQHTLEIPYTNYREFCQFWAKLTAYQRQNWQGFCGFLGGFCFVWFLHESMTYCVPAL